MQSWRTIFALFPGALLGVFTLQNLAPVDLAFLVWDFDSCRIDVIIVSLIVGLTIGWISGYAAERKPSNRFKDQGTTA